MTYIKQEFIDNLKEQIDIVDIVGRYSKLRRQGSTHVCLSPLGNEKTPSFVVYPSSQRFVDYHTDKSGDVIAFIMEKESLSYPKAIEHLASMIGIPVEYEDAEWAREKAKQVEKKESLRPLLVRAHELYKAKLKEIRSEMFEHQAKAELEKRDYDESVITDWGLGYAPGGKFLSEKMSAAGQLAPGVELFLVGQKEGKHWDKYWDRLIYPLHDENGLLIGFAGRDVSQKTNQEKNKTAKWINPADTPLYNKEKTWFALHRAIDAIRKKKEAWILEGYNDVIGWHINGITNAVAPCGTATTERQVKILKRYCQKVVFGFDGDDAGIKAVIRNLPLFIKNGFEVEVVQLPGCDPDDFSRIWKAWKGSEEEDGLARLMSEKEIRKNGFTLLLNHHIHGDIDFTQTRESHTSELQKSQGARKLVEIVATVDDESFREIYLGWISRESGLKPTVIKNWFKDSTADLQQEKINQERYHLPKSVKSSLKELLPDIERYGLFMANDQIWVITGDGKPYSFMSVSNFSIEIIQHMQDEKLPMKLVRIRNIHGDERIFDVPSENLNTPQNFDNAMTNHGNFLWTGGRGEFQLLRRYLFDRMGVGHKIEVLGWQPDGFWIWNNGVTIPGSGTRDIDENGVFKYDKPSEGESSRKISYYIPSANRIYANNTFKFTPQKKVKVLRSNISISQYFSKMIQVHRGHAISGSLFTMASTFLDIIEDKLGNFPLLFLYGPASSGKDQLIDCCQSFFGEPQTPIHIGNKVSTSKAQVRKFAQFRNMIVHLSEYRTGDQQLDELLKGFWDRRGYERGTIDSAYGTETVPIHSSVIFTGNHYPDDDALITRFIAEEMTKTDFSQDEKNHYQELKDINKNGISCLTEQLLQHRQLWHEKFKETFRLVESNLRKDLTIATSHDRMIGNVAVLGTAYELMKDQIQFPYSFIDFMEHIRRGMDKQVRKLNTISVAVKWWDCFLACIRTKTDPLRHGREFEVRDNQLYFNFTHCYNRVISQWWAQYHEQVPGKSKISDLLKEDSTFIESKNSHRMQDHKSSVWVMDIRYLSIGEDLAEAIEWQRRENSDMIPTNPVPPESDSNQNQSSIDFNQRSTSPGSQNAKGDETDDLPF